MQRLGALYGLQKKFQEAVAFSLRSISIETSNPNPVSKADFLVRVYHNLQMFYDSLHMSVKKIDAVDSCVNIAIRSGRINGEVVYNTWQRAYYNLVVGDYQRCLDYSNIGDGITKYCSDSAERDFMETGFFYMRVNSLTLLRRFPVAQIILENKIKVYRSRNQEKSCGIFYNQLAEISTQQHHYDSSLYFLSKSLECNQKAACMYCCKQSYNNIGFLYQSRLNDPVRALPYYFKALACKNNMDQYHDQDVIETLNIYDNIAKVYAQLSKFDSALFYYDKAFVQLGPGMDDQKIQELSTDELMTHDNLQYVIGLIKDKGDAFVLQYAFSKDPAFIKTAIATYKIADRLLTRVKREQAESISGIAWRANARNLYEKAIEACILKNDIDNAFFFFEKSRSAFLMDQVNNQRRSSPEEITQQNGLRKRIALLKKKLDSTASASTQYAAVQGDLLIAMRENDRVSLDIKKRDPFYYHHYIDTSFISIRSVQDNVLKDNHSLMELFYGDSAVYILFISKGQKMLNRIDKKNYDRLTEEYLKYLSDPALLNVHYDGFIRLSNQLYSTLFAGVHENTEGLVISPDGRNFPFESLVNHHDGLSPHFLVYDHAISYAYSALHLMSNVDNMNSPGNFMGMAPVNFDMPDLARLPASDRSLETISRLFSRPYLLLRTLATKNNFLRNFDRYAVIQLYTHASDANSSGEPEIFFSDSTLRLSDLDPVFKPATRLIVLSACETGNGNFYKSEGVFSFNRVFASIGIPSSVVNLWSVDNEAVYRLTELFYKFLSRGMPLDLSLQKAKMEFIATASRDHTMPYYWASAVIVGRTDPVVAPADIFFEKLLCAIAIFVSLIYLVILYYKKN